jgi:F0F1-type ATP synthase assembly protein I
MNELNRKLEKIKRINIEIKKLIVSLVFTYMAWKVYSNIEFWKFPLTYIMGRASVHIVGCFDEDKR